MVQLLEKTVLKEVSKSLKKRFEQFNYSIDEISKKEIHPYLENQFSYLMVRFSFSDGKMMNLKYEKNPN